MKTRGGLKVVITDLRIRNDEIRIIYIGGFIVFMLLLTSSDSAFIQKKRLLFSFVIL